MGQTRTSYTGTSPAVPNDNYINGITFSLRVFIQIRSQALVAYV